MDVAYVTIFFLCKACSVISGFRREADENCALPGYYLRNNPEERSSNVYRIYNNNNNNNNNNIY